jgi:hypothetical protein
VLNNINKGRRAILLTYRLQSEGHITELTPRCSFIFDKLLLHGALIHESSPTLMLTGQKDVLVEGPSLLSYHGKGLFTHLMPRCTPFTCCCMVM